MKKKFTENTEKLLNKRNQKPTSMDDFLNDNSEPESRKAVITANRKAVKKTVFINAELNDALRTLAFNDKTSEKSIVEAALKSYLKRKKVL